MNDCRGIRIERGFVGHAYVNGAVDRRVSVFAHSGRGGVFVIVSMNLIGIGPTD